MVVVVLMSAGTLHVHLVKAPFCSCPDKDPGFSCPPSLTFVLVRAMPLQGQRIRLIHVDLAVYFALA